MTSDPRFPALFVIGIAHCGSTLFGRMLDSHPRIRCTGETLWLDRALRDGTACSCGARLDRCPEWQRLMPLLGPEHGYDHRKLSFEHFLELRRAAGADMLVDLSKTRVWRQGRGWREQGAGYVLLIRDPRGVLAATQRAKKDVRSRIGRYIKWQRRLAEFAKQSGDSAMVVFYEDLCRDNEATLRRVTEFCGLPYDEAMQRPADQKHHFIGPSRSPYLKGSNELRVDERWRTELRAPLLAEIEKAVARVPLPRERYLEGPESAPSS